MTAARSFWAGVVLALVLSVAVLLPQLYAAGNRLDGFRHVAAVQGHELDVIGTRCAINRVDGSATCPVGVFATLRVALP